MEDQPQEHAPLSLPMKVDTNLNFRLGSGGMQVRVAYNTLHSVFPRTYS